MLIPNETAETLFEHLPLPCHEINSDGLVLRVNSAECALLGYDASKVIGLPVWTLVAPELRETSRLAIGRKVRRELPLSPFQREYVASDGRRLTMEIHEQLLHDHFGRVTGLRTLMLDITERVRAQQELGASEERWQLALRGTNDGLFDWNPRTSEVYYSARWKEMLGYSETEVPNTTREWESRIHPADRDRVLECARAHLNRETDFYSIEYRLQAKDGSYRWILARGQALWMTKGMRFALSVHTAT